MTVQVLSIRAQSSFRRRQQNRLRAVSAHAATEAVEQAAPVRRRGAEPLEDTALYNCQCGFVFHAPVSTSVGCPHCSATQAW
jgi:predicted Zn-ribbon and HTH transcriptional regulator